MTPSPTLTLTADEHAELLARRQLSHRDQRKLAALIAVFIAFTESAATS